ncbi:NnrU family protein [Rhizobium lemnae]|uniref:NnrU family protein n=1 Tax=Rhizobium lemnae TaxID=1214924 RepID=A0ABV8EDG8_9HYPH|nr:NnrU family protein [Rhizobium lemnae]MCJ8507368.1 NnrU family protein [Rhizobium lemnae]
MEELLIAGGLFIALHSIPASPQVRSRLIGLLGRTVYLVLYSLASTLVLIWLFVQALRMDYVELWAPAAWQAAVNFVLSPIGLFLVLAGLLSPNPYSVTLRKPTGDCGAILRLTRHPVLWGFFLWAIGHVIANGDVRSLVLFGGFAGFSLMGIRLQNKRAARQSLPKWRIQPQARIDRPMIVGLLLTSAALLLLLTGGHALLFGADPLVMLTIQ